jgi:putative FmdB family regulatory protein
MPLYEYYCTRCGSKFEELRPIARADESATCAKGHRGATRTLSVFAAVSRGGAADAPATLGGGGGCGCGGGACGCGH